MKCEHCQVDRAAQCEEIAALRREVRRLEDWGGDLEVLVSDLNEYIKTIENSRQRGVGK